MAWLEFLGVTKQFDLPKIKSGSKKKRLHQKISEEEVEKIISEGYRINKKFGLIIDILYHGALRRFEVGTIKINNINWDKWFEDPSEFCEYSVIGKGDKERIVLMHPRSTKMIIDFLFNKGLLYPNIPPAEVEEKLKLMDQTLFKVSERMIYKKVREYSENIIKRKIRPHQLRHAKATHLEKHGILIRDIQKYLGHSSLAVTEGYLHNDGSKALGRIKAIAKV